MSSSLVIYLSAFSISIVNFYIVTKVRVRIDEVGKVGVILKKIISFAFIFFPVIFIYGYRYNVGKDYINYLNFYKSVLNTSNVNIFGNYMESGYVILNIIAKVFIEEGYGIFFVSGVLIFGLLFWILESYKEKINVILGCYIFFMVYMGVACNIVRQMIAVLIMLYGFRYLVERDHRKFFLTIIIASLFHKTALFCFVFWFLVYFKRQNLKYIKLFSFIFGITLIIFQKYVRNVIWQIGLYRHLITWEGTKSIKGLAFLLYVAPVLCIVELLKKELLKKDERYSIWVSLFYLQVPMQCLGTFNLSMDRMALYASIIQVLLLPTMINAIDNKRKRRNATIICAVWYFIYFIFMNMVLNGNKMFPYNVWS